MEPLVTCPGRGVRACRRGLLALALAGSLPAGAVAQVEIRSAASAITITGSVHAQFTTTSLEDEPEAEFRMRRVRLAADVTINDVVSGRVQPDFGGGTIALQDAYLRLTFHPAFRVAAGQFKRAFDLFELTSSSQILVIERAGDVRGVDACTGPGGTCSFSRLTEKLQFAGRDIGVLVDGRFGSAAGYSLSVTNGTGLNTEDENGAKSASGRIQVTPVRHVTVGGNVAAHDYLEPVSADLAEDEYALAYGGDVEIGTFDRGPHFQGGVVAGDNWLSLVAGEPAHFLTAQGILTWKIPFRPNPLADAIEPVARLSWADPDTDADNDDALLATGGVVLHFVRRNKVAANVDVWIPREGDREWSLKVQSYLHF